MKVLDWLLDSDPAIRWQVMRDLVGAPAEIIADECTRTVQEGWGPDCYRCRAKTASGREVRAFRRGVYSSGRRNRASPGFPHYRRFNYCMIFGIDPHSERVARAVALVRDHCRWEHAG